MSDTPPRMDREKLARVEDRGGRSIVLLGNESEPESYLEAYDERVYAEDICEDINAASSAWLDREVKKVIAGFKSELRAIHGPTADCTDQECSLCAFIDCPFHDALHYHHDGCPAEYVTDEEEIKRAVDAERERCLQAINHARAYFMAGPHHLDVAAQRGLDRAYEEVSAIRSAPGQEKGK